MGWDTGGRKREKRWTKDRCDGHEIPRVRVYNVRERNTYSYK